MSVLEKLFSRFAPKKKPNPGVVMSELRLKMLHLKPEEIEAKPTLEFPHVYGVILDWPLEGQTVSIIASCKGDASLYTTSTFGIVGGVDHYKVRQAAAQFVFAAEKHFVEAVPTTDFSLPKPDRIKFFLVTYEGVRLIEAGREPVMSAQDQYSPFFGAGQAVLTELRLVIQKQK